jgi:hypothetical protein
VSINHISNVILFADDTSVLVTDDSYDNFEQKVDLASSYLIKWFQANQLVLNTEKKTNIVKFTPTNSLYAPLAVKYANQ